MTLLIIGLIAWFVAHLFPIMAPGPRGSLKTKLGGAYMAIFAVATVATLGLIVIGYQQAPIIEVWNPPSFLIHVNNLLMVIAVFFFIAGSFKTPVRRITRHPQLNGVKTWAIAHLLVNGDLASILLFGAMLAWGVVAMIGSNKRDGKPPIEVETSSSGLLIHIAATLGVTAAVLALHWHIGSVWPLPG